MLICKGEKSYKCSKIKTNTIEETQVIRFKVIEPMSSSEIANLFEDSTFYFYDNVLKGRMAETNNTKLVGLSITYNANSTYDIKIKLIKGDAYDES